MRHRDEWTPEREAAFRRNAQAVVDIGVRAIVDIWASDVRARGGHRHASTLTPGDRHYIRQQPLTLEIFDTRGIQ